MLSAGYLECFKTEGILLFPVLVSVHGRFNVSTTSVSVVLKTNSGGAYELFSLLLRGYLLPLRDNCSNLLYKKVVIVFVQLGRR